MFFDSVVDTVDFFPARIEGKSTSEDLDAEMVFLVDHQADVFFAAESDTAGTGTISVFTADELAFDEELTIEIFEGIDIDVTEAGSDFEDVEFFSA